MTTHYVLGFMFDPDLQKVVMVKKTHPEWQAGKLNAPGGRFHPIAEEAHRAMAREFKEETGMDTEPRQWRHFADLAGDDYNIYCFASALPLVFPTTGCEQVNVIQPDGLAFWRHMLVEHCEWLIPLAREVMQGVVQNQRRFRVRLRYSPKGQE